MNVFEMYALLMSDLKAFDTNYPIQLFINNLNSLNSSSMFQIYFSKKKIEMGKLLPT